MRMFIGAIWLTLVLSCSGGTEEPRREVDPGTLPVAGTAKLTLASDAFEDSAHIPMEYTCDSLDISPPLQWSGVPETTQSLALICDDPDAPGRTWVHWVIYNIPPDTNGLEVNVPPDTMLANGALQGVTDFKRVGYGGPCPPSGIHRYVFKLYALDTRLGLGAWASKAELLAAMEGHIIAQAELVGRYSRTR